MRKGFKYILASASFWAISIVLTRHVLNSGENVFTLTFWTMLLSSPFWLFLFNRHREEFKNLDKKDYLIILGIGIISSVGVKIFQNLALKYTSATNYSLLIRSIIVFTMLFAYLFLNEKITLKKVMLAVMILSGSYLLITEGKSLELSKGDIFTLINAALIAFGNNILGKIATSRMSPTLSASASVLIGIIPIIFIAYMNDAIKVPQSFLSVIVLVIVSMSGALFRFNGYKHASASLVAVVFSVTPVLVAVIAIPLLKETLSTIQIVGGTLIISSGLIAEKLKI